MSNYTLNQVVKIDGFALGMIKELPSKKNDKYLIAVAGDLKRVDGSRIKPIVKGTGAIKKDEKRNG